MIKNLVSFERYLLLVEEVGLSNLLIVVVLEGMVDDCSLFDVVFRWVLRDFFAISGDKNDLFCNECSLSWLSIDCLVECKSESDLVAMVWIVTLNDYCLRMMERNFNHLTCWYEYLVGNYIQWQLNQWYLVVVVENFFVLLI